MDENDLEKNFWLRTNTKVGLGILKGKEGIIQLTILAKGFILAVGRVQVLESGDFNSNSSFVNTRLCDLEQVT